ncbi:conserved hypothetical protein [Tenacibaculum maritimum]|uniref:hypothetical protein n=1 Tax=Tenacibaculum maritimum TaxID=107401 RepID=UPI0012E59CEE|nr:hypothetical protein [Tenacibaculum maritimum]CAA0153128.1 conserved hypothetical protein [Tenacibaculum maritimum]CAA0207949.1 conserved hypothetical protein [Tenacibaculum maritimum]
MKKVTVLNRQTFFDLSLVFSGKRDNAFLIAKANQKNPSNEIAPGSEIMIPESVIKDREVLEYYNIKNVLPATGLTANQEDIITGCEGIGCWVIGIDFKVS